MNPIRIVPLVAAIVVASTVKCWGLNLALDYTYDSFFALHPTAKASLDAAAQDISSAITTSLGATADTNTASKNITTITFDYKYTYTQPNNGASQTFDPAVLPANEVRIFVGVQNIEDVNVLGKGGPGGYGLARSGFSYTDPNDVVSVIQTLQAAGNANMGRGAGPVINHISGSTSVPNTNYTVNFGSSIGNLWFDVDTNNDNITDSETTLNNFWQFDHTAPVGGKNDFYSVALHELLHAIGFGRSESWNNLVTGTHSWLGAQVNSLLGTGTGVLGPDDQHVAEGLLSTRLSDGAAQEAVMDPTLTTGTRKTLTRLDLAFLRDMGWSTIAYPYLLGDFNFDNRRTAEDIPAMLMALTDLNKFKSDHGLTNANLLAIGDLNGDSAVTNADIQRLLNMVATEGGAGSLVAVPEPTGIALVLAGAILLGKQTFSRRKNDGV